MNFLAVWALAGGILALTLKILNDLDVNKVVYNHSPGKCRYVTGIDKGSEDIAILSSGSHALISSGAYIFGFGPPISYGEGNIFLFDFNDASSKAIKLDILPSSDWNRTDFHPTGLGLFEASGNKPLVYAINTKLIDVIEVFELSVGDKSLKHLRSLRDPLFKGLNNIAIVGKDVFYASNYFSYKNAWLATAQILLQLPLGTVVYFDGKTGHDVLTGLKGPNGLALSKDKKTLFVSVNMAEELHIYRIKSEKDLELLERKELYTAIDNLNLDADGNIWTAAHPIAYQFLQHALNPSLQGAPSQVLKVGINSQSRITYVEEIFADDGEQIRGSTVAAVQGNKLLIGTLFHKVYLCDLSK